MLPSNSRISVMTAWMANGALKDGTLLMGPLFERPKDDGFVAEIEVDGRTYYVRYCCKALSPAQLTELSAWVKARVPVQSA
jgi:hypothetical protein